MANLIQKVVQRSQWPNISMDEWVSFFSYGGLNYTSTLNQTMQGNTEEVSGSYESLIQAAYKSNGIVFACMLARQLVFSEARFVYRQRRNGRPGDYFGTKALAVLERPWPGGVTADLLSRAIQDVDLAGNFFCTRRPSRIRRLRPDWVTIILGSYDDPDVQAGDIDAEVVGYMYHPGGRLSGRKPTFLLREDVAHFAPIPDPTAMYRGMSWLVPIIREFVSDSAMITHKSKFFENGATPNMVVTLDPSIKKEAFKEWVQMFSDKHEGALNAYKTLYLGAGSTVMPVGKDFKQMEFSTTQGAGETRIAAAAGVPPVIVGLSEGLKAATYSNYGMARRRFADMTIRPLWRSMATSFEILVPPEDGAELWYDDRDIPFLVEDFKDRAEVQAHDAASIRQLVDAGYEPDSVVQAITNNDLTLLVHSGLYSVQLQPPGAKQGEDPAEKPTPKPPEPAPPPEEKKSRPTQREAAELLIRMAELRQLDARNGNGHAPPPPPNVEVHLHEGMIRHETPITIESPTTIHEGAFRADAPSVQVDSPIQFQDGAFRVEVPTTFEEGAIRAGDVTVEPPQVHVDPGAVHVEIDSPTTIERGAVEVEIAPAETRFEEGAIKVDAPTTIEAGAVQVDSPVTVERSDVHVDPGAVQLSAPVTVERTEVHVDEGAVQVSSPVTVERTEVHVDEGAFKADIPVTVERSEFHLDPGSVTVPVTVERTEVHIDEGAVRVDNPVTIEEGAFRADAPQITVETPEVRVEAPITVHPAETRFEEGAIKVDAQTTIEEGAVRVDSPVTMERGAVEVQVDNPVQISEGAVQVDSRVERGAIEVEFATPEVIVEEPKKRGRVTRQTEFKRDVDGKIVGKREIESDALGERVRETEFEVDSDGNIVGKREVETDE